MEDLKPYGKSENEIKELLSKVSIVEVFSQDIGMEFGIKKCGVIIMKRGNLLRRNHMTNNLLKEQSHEKSTFFFSLRTTSYNN